MLFPEDDHVIVLPDMHLKRQRQKQKEQAARDEV